MERATGFYWVLMGGEALVAKWTQEYLEWSICGIEVTFNDREFDNIDERRLERKPVKGENKFWRDVPESHAGWTPN